MTLVNYSAVDALIRTVGDTLLMQHWRALSADAVREKSKGDFVTDVDEEAERRLSAGLTALAPHTAVLGEEAAAANPTLLNLLQHANDLWIIDPIDGTSNYIEGKPCFAIMVAFVTGGITQASWIYQPVLQKMFFAKHGGGAFCNGQRLQPTTADTGAFARSRVCAGASICQSCAFHVRGLRICSAGRRQQSHGHVSSAVSVGSCARPIASAGSRAIHSPLRWQPL
jgi:fructose-1,6-bisphosphatase/inositol monophosphatase family enzyme